MANGDLLDRRTFLGGALAATALLAGDLATGQAAPEARTRPSGAAALPTGRRPNVLLLFSDQHNARVLGCAGHPDVKTPSLDRLAGEGMRFDRAYCQDAICCPSRASLMTGLYPRSMGVLFNGDDLVPGTRASSHWPFTSGGTAIQPGHSGSATWPSTSISMPAGMLRPRQHRPAKRRPMNPIGSGSARTANGTPSSRTGTPSME